MGIGDLGKQSLKSLKSTLGKAGNFVSDQVQKPTEIRLAVTGLSRSGKTVFVTSIISNLIAYSNGARVLDRFDILGAGERIKSVREASPGISSIARFPYRENLQAMASEEPEWPPRTADITELALEIEIARSKTLVSNVLGDRKIRLIVSDYPGEWLLDLPLMKLNFPDWSSSLHRAMTSGSLRHHSKPFLELVQQVDVDFPASEEIARRLHSEYKSVLVNARDKEGVRFLQPGRFICPGPWGDVPLLWFAPLPPSRSPDAVGKGSLYSLMAQRYDAYKRDIEEKFFKPVFAKIDRQIILVDVLGTLCAGRSAFEDTREAVVAITQAIAQDNSSWFSWLKPRGGSVVLAATKSDHVPSRQRDALSILLSKMVGEAVADAKVGNSNIETCAIASIQCTKDDTGELDGRAIAVVSGVPIGQNRLIKFFPGEVPISIPDDEFWKQPYFELPKFKPPQIDPSGKDGIPHTNIDLALKLLLGGVL